MIPADLVSFLVSYIPKTNPDEVFAYGPPNDLWAVRYRLCYQPFAGAGRSATNLSDTDNSSSWKCGRRNATAR